MCYNFSCKRFVSAIKNRAGERTCLRFVGNNSVTHYRNVNRSFVGFMCTIPHTLYLYTHSIQFVLILWLKTAACRKRRIMVSYAWFMTEFELHSNYVKSGTLNGSLTYSGCKFWWINLPIFFFVRPAS